MTKKLYNNLYDLMLMNLNMRAMAEIKKRKYKAVKTAIAYMTDVINDAKVNGKKIKRQRREMMIDVLGVLYTYLYNSDFGQVSPSLRTIAQKVDPTLEVPSETDDKFTAKIKERAMHKVVMSVQRAVHTLKEIGVIKIHEYYVDEAHYNSNKNACFFYEITPISTYFPRFALEVRTKKTKVRTRKVNFPKAVYMPSKKQVAAEELRKALKDISKDTNKRNMYLKAKRDIFYSKYLPDTYVKLKKIERSSYFDELRDLCDTPEKIEEAYVVYQLYERFKKRRELRNKESEV